jgi:hypothetical protein
MVRRRTSATAGAGWAFIALGTALLVSGGAPADAAPTTVQVTVGSKITLSGVTPSFALTGDPETTVGQNGVVAMNVKTNNHTGYTVTVQADAPSLSGTIAGNTDVVPVGSIGVRETGGGALSPLSAVAPVTVHSQSTRSAGPGDDLSNDFQVTIPFVNADTYSGTLTYLAAANP